jgi:hypothetical protein
VEKKADFIGVNWEGLVPLPPLDGLENHCAGNCTGGSNPSPSANISLSLMLAERAVFRHRAARAALGTNPSANAFTKGVYLSGGISMSTPVVWPGSAVTYATRAVVIDAPIVADSDVGIPHKTYLPS